MKEFDDAMLDVAWNNLNFQYTRFKDIDTKAIGIITITGILITFLSKPTGNGCLSNTLFITTSLFFLMTILLSVGAIAMRKYDALSTNNLIDELSHEGEKRQIRGITGTMAKVEKEICDAANKKADILKFAIFSLGASIILLIFYSISTFIKFV
jgi:hypothetical protein